MTTRCSNEVCWSPPWPTSSSHCWSLRIRWISPPGRCWSASRLDLSSCTLDAKNWRGGVQCGLGSYIKLIWKLHFFHWNCHGRIGVGDTYWDFPSIFYSEVQLAAFFGHFSAFWTEVWIGSFDRIYGRRRRGPARRRKRKWTMAAFWDSRLVYLPSVGGDWGEFLFPPVFFCVFPCMSCLRLFCHFVCFWSSRMQWRTKGPTATLKLTLGTRITCAHGWVIRNTTSVDGERQGLGGYLWAGKRESQATLPGGGQGQIFRIQDSSLEDATFCLTCIEDQMRYYIDL